MDMLLAAQRALRSVDAFSRAKANIGQQSKWPGPIQLISRWTDRKRRARAAQPLDPDETPRSFAWIRPDPRADAILSSRSRKESGEDLLGFAENLDRRLRKRIGNEERLLSGGRASDAEEWACWTSRGRA